MVREGDFQTQPFEEDLLFRNEVKAATRDVCRCGNFFEGRAPLVRGAKPDRLADLNATTTAVELVAGRLHVPI